MLVFVGVAMAQVAQARVETLRWEHGDPAQVAGFKLHLGPASRSYDEVLDIGRPTQAADGTFSYGLSLADDASVYVAVSAYDAGGAASALSNEQFRPGDTSTDTSTDSGTSGSGDSTLSDGSGGSTGGSTDSSSGSSTDTSSDTDFLDATLPIGSDPNSLWYEDFETSALGSFLPSWVDTEADNSMQENDALFSVAELGSNRVLTTQSTGINIHSHYMGAGSSEWSAYELRGGMRISDAQGGVGVTAYSQYDRSDVYYRLRRFRSGGFELSMHPDITCQDDQTEVVPQAHTWYRYRLRIEETADGARVRAKVWPSGTAEPSLWQAECLDARAARPVAGRVGAWSMGPGRKYWDDFEVVGLGSSDASGGAATGAPPSQPLLLN